MNMIMSKITIYDFKYINMYNIVYAITLTIQCNIFNRIGLQHIIFLLEKIIPHMEIDFDKQCSIIEKKCKKIDNETENLENDFKILQQRIEEYRYYNMETIGCAKVKMYIILI